MLCLGIQITVSEVPDVSRKYLQGNGEKRTEEIMDIIKNVKIKIIRKLGKKGGSSIFAL